MSLLWIDPPTVPTETGSHAAATSELAPVPDSSDYQKMDSQLYYHTSSGCYYEAVSHSHTCWVLSHSLHAAAPAVPGALSRAI